MSTPLLMPAPRSTRTVAVMDDIDPIDALSPAYADALRFRAEGATDSEIAERLGLEPEGVDALLRLAQAKLDRVIRAEADRGSADGSTPG
jgi:DNA-binding CsgD family transcriptional regulator